MPGRISVIAILLCVFVSPTKHLAQENAKTVSRTLLPNLMSAHKVLQQRGQERIWSGSSAGFFIEWTTRDLTYQSPAGTKNLFSDLFKKGVEDFIKSQPDAAGCQYERYFEVLSVTGSLVSFADYGSYYCGGAHPTLDTRFTTVDLLRQGDVAYQAGEDTSGMDVDPEKPGKIVKLTDFFSEAEILTALLADRIVKQALKTVPPVAPPQALAELPKLFEENDYELGDSGYELRPDFLTRFVFHHTEADRVAIRLGLPPHYEANRARHLQLGLLLTIPTTLRQALSQAEPQRQGFLMKDAAKIRGRKTTTFKKKNRLIRPSLRFETCEEEICGLRGTAP